MPLSVKHPEADRLARELARATGETITDAVITALRERLEREGTPTPSREERIAQLEAMSRRVAALPVLDPDFTQDSLYDEFGLPG
jgi:antitoxin VapB